MTATATQPLAPASVEREWWIQTKSEYEKALAIATQIWTANHPPETLNAVTATLLIHFNRLREAEQKKQAPARANGGEPAPACEMCGGAMYDNRGNKKRPNSPDFKCKSSDCGHAVWLKRKKQAQND